jgi:hypothetical protein
MTIRKKYLLLSALIDFLIVFTVGIFSLKSENFLFNYLVYPIIFLVLLMVNTGLWMYLYSNYMNVLDNELDPEKFIELTENEYNKNKNKKYRNYMKLNLSAGYSSAGKIETAYEKLKEVDLSKKLYRERNKILYYYNEALILNVLGKKEEATEIYNKELSEEIEKIGKRKKDSEIYNLIKALEGMLFHENDNEKMIEILNEALKKTKTKRQNLGLKHLLAAYKEKAGKIEEAIELYKEVAENGNKLYIVQEAKEKLENINRI